MIVFCNASSIREGKHALLIKPGPPATLSAIAAIDYTNNDTSKTNNGYKNFLLHKPAPYNLKEKYE